MILWKCCTQYASKFGKLSPGQSGKGQFSFQSQRRAMPKNVQTRVQFHSFHMLASLCSKSFQVQFQQYVTCEIPDIPIGFYRDRGTRNQTASIHWIMEKAMELQKNIYLCFLNYSKAFGWIKTNYGKFLKGWKYQTTLPFLSPEKPVCGSRSNS